MIKTISKENAIFAYKGFNDDFSCRGFHYEVGKEYEIKGEIKCCERGFHACESPMEVFDYYNMFNSRFAEVEQSGQIDKEDDNKSTKICSSRIKIKAELKLADIINIGIEWLKDITSSSNVKADIDLNDNGCDSAQIGSSGYYAQIGSSGNSAKICSSGYYAQIGSSGNYAKIGSIGNSAQICSSGDYAQINSTGEYSVIMCAGKNSAAKAKAGSWITLSEWVYDEEKRITIPKCVKTEYVDGKRIKEDTWYKLKNGEFIEVDM